MNERQEIAAIRTAAEMNEQNMLTEYILPVYPFNQSCM